ncbi:ELL-associated factor 2 [Impatiens glandulifera]|uniref:ELL-associated factor 2 n=1 Tax=Impatiens glandulifera TaxID=253017 RepID=UPI001FB09707|nr:ELL-associated factor 2 [Impatiens glandulifera]
MASNHKDEPKTAPQPDRWYNLTLGSSFKDHNASSKFCTLRYEFKPASIDKNQTGSLHKTKDNRVTVGFQNNQPGKPKVNFEGSSEDYKETDAVLLFDGSTMRLERLHRAVKRLRHVRLPGESAAAPAVTSLAQAAVESSPPPMNKVAKFQSLNKSVPQLIPVEVERIEIGNFNSSAPPDAKPKNEKATTTDYQSAQYNNPLSEESPYDNKHDDLDEQLDILNDDDEEEEGEDANRGSIDYGMKDLVSSIDINQPHGNGNDTDEEIADVDVSDDEEDKGRNAAEELRAQVNNAAQKKDEQSSSSSGSSGSDSSGSGSSRSGSSSSDSESSDAGDSVNSI